MRKQLLTLFSGAVLSLGLAGAAHAQYSLIVNQPANLAGSVSATVDPSNTGWGFGDPQTITPGVTGFVQYAAPDTLVPLGANIGNLSGKIAICHRGGGISFGEKALRCQRAGAIGVIIINSTGAAIGGMSAGDSGAITNIPVIMATREWESSVRPFLANGTMNVTIGNPIGAFAFNLAVLKGQVAFPTQIHIPSHLVNDTGDVKFPLGGNIINIGNQGQTDVSLTATVRRVSPRPARLYHDSAFFPTIAATGSTTGGDTVGSRFAGVFDLVGSDPSAPGRDWSGHYQVIYEATSPNTDANPTDNKLVIDFYVGIGGTNAYSRTRLDTNAAGANFLRPINTISLTKSGGGALKWGQAQRFNAHGGRVSDITFAATTNTADSLSGESIDLEVHEWVDANTDGLITDDELTLKGSGNHQFVSNSERGVYFTIPIQDINTGNDTVDMSAGKTYLYLVVYNGTKSVFIAADEGVDYTVWSNLNVNNDQVAPLFNGTTWGSFTLDQTAALRVNVHKERFTAVRNSLGTMTRLTVYPNPAQDRIQVSVGDKVGTGSALIQIRDLAGQVVATETRALTGVSSDFKMSVASLPAGIYNVSVSTNAGAKTQKLVITR